MLKFGARQRLFALSLASMPVCMTGQAIAMECANLLDSATDMRAPFRINDGNLRSAWSSNPAPFLVKNISAVVEFPGIPDHHLYLSKSINVCRSEGCDGQLYSTARGYSYYSPIFIVTSAAVFFSWTGFGDESTLMNFADVTINDAKNQVGSYMSFENTDFQTLYADGVAVSHIEEWINFGGPGYGAIPSKLFSSIPTSTRPGCGL